VKNPIKFKIPLNEEQKEAKEKILYNTLTLLAGKAGSGKTLLACQVALDGLLRRHYEKIIITRPTVSKEEIGFLPGDLREKMDPWIQPIYQNMYALYDKSEAQNVTHEQMEMIATRIGIRSKMIICGDDHQVDLKSKRDSGFKFLYSQSFKVKNMTGITLLKNHRDPIVDELIEIYNEAEDRGIIKGSSGTSGRSR
jgi:phosphate starvation-inducible PhoH-like protein